jgi:hypothetical protein
VLSIVTRRFSVQRIHIKISIIRNFIIKKQDSRGDLKFSFYILYD